MARNWPPIHVTGVVFPLNHECYTCAPDTVRLRASLSVRPQSMLLHVVWLLPVFAGHYYLAAQPDPTKNKGPMPTLYSLECPRHHQVSVLRYIMIAMLPMIMG